MHSMSWAGKPSEAHLTRLDDNKKNKYESNASSFHENYSKFVYVFRTA